jgi:hypothetical protein
MKITSGKQTRAQRVVIYGVESVGKSTFAAKFPKPLFLDIESGTAHLDVDRVEIGNWAELLGALVACKTTDYETIIIDSADWAERLCTEDLLASSKKQSIEDFGFGKGWVMVAERMSRMLAAVDHLIECGKNVVLIAHSKIVRFEAPDALAAYDRYELKLSKQCSPLLKEFADELWFMRFKTRVSTTDTGRGKGIGGKERIILTTHSAAYDAKTRSGLAEELPMEWESVAHLFAKPAAKPVNAIADKKEVPPWQFVIEEHADDVNAFLLDKNIIAAGSGWRDASPKALLRMEADTTQFLAIVAEWKHAILGGKPTKNTPSRSN